MRIVCELDEGEMVGFEFVVKVAKTPTLLGLVEELPWVSCGAGNSGQSRNQNYDEAMAHRSSSYCPSADTTRRLEHLPAGARRQDSHPKVQRASGRVQPHYSPKYFGAIWMPSSHPKLANASRRSASAWRRTTPQPS
jgi:hypothetical protein